MLKFFPADYSTEFPTRERCNIVELMNDPDWPDFSVAHCRVEPGVTTELHALRDTHEVYVVLQGEGLMDDGRNPGQVVSPLDCVQIPPGYPQRVQNTGTQDLIFLAICAQRFEGDVYLAHEEPERVAPDYSANARRGV